MTMDEEPIRRDPHVGVFHNMPVKGVRLNCGHEVQFRSSVMPEPGAEVWCVRCDKYCHRPFPLETGPDGMPVLRGWSWVCATGKGCNCGKKSYGADMAAAYAAARKHSVNNGGHEVWVISRIGCVADRWAMSTALFDRNMEVVKDATQPRRQTRPQARYQGSSR